MFFHETMGNNTQWCGVISQKNLYFIQAATQTKTRKIYDKIMSYQRFNMPL